MHPFRDALQRPAARHHPRAVKRAIDAIRTCPEYPYTAVTLAALTGVSVRTLQASFQHHVGTSPMALPAARPTGTGARRPAARPGAHGRRGREPVGFTHLGRF